MRVPVVDGRNWTSKPVCPPGCIVPSVPGRYAKLAKPVDAIVQRCLKKDADARYRSISELRLAIKQVAAVLPRR